jgi:peptidoglycan hydrolase CwlO-like protein
MSSNCTLLITDLLSSSADSYQKDISHKFLCLRDLDEQISTVDEQIRQLVHKEKHQRTVMAQVLRKNHQAETEIDNTRDQLHTIYDVSLEVRREREREREREGDVTDTFFFELCV